MTPQTARQAERLNVNVTSFFTHFADGATVANFGPGITVNAVDAIDATHAVVDVTVSPGAALGARTVVMTTGSELAELVGGFTVTPGQPTLFSVSPNSAMQGTSLTVVLGGAFTNFTPQLTTAFFGSGISVGTVTVNGPTLASVPITIAPGATVGARTVTVTTGSEVVGLINGFTVTQGTPTVVSIDPNAGQHGVTLNVTITGVFTNWQTGATTVSYGAGVTVNSNVVNSATSITTNITIDAGAALGLRDVIVTTGAESLTVAGGFAVTDVDTTLPTLLRLSPGSGSTGIPLNTVSTFEFSEPLLRSTVTEATVQLYDQTLGTFIDADVSLDATGRVATLVPSRLLAVNRGHTVYLSQLITDVAGNHLGFQGYSFTTGFSTDTTGPTLRQANPQSGDTGIARNVKLVLQFDRSINLATLAIGVRLQTGGVTVPGTYVQEDGQRRLRFTPASPLAADTTYTLTLTSELKDVAGNALTNPGTIAFTTGPDSDTVAPTVTAGTPYYNQIDIGLRPVIRVAFNERINPISLMSSAFYLYNYYTGAVVRTMITVAPDRLSATLVPDAPLAPHSYYYYYVSPFSDLAGNTGSLGATYFRTGGVEDTEPPAIVAIAPANGATGVPVNARIRVLVSEPIDAASVTASTVQLTPAVAGTITVDTDRLGFLFTPAANLAVSTNYALQIGPLRDTSGNLRAA
ncbi:MAG TPA: Ig-like domain-containing protein, partial [Desertimonas sp.]|nr:Ig-like domain-containing protein [Desertimonas sp.]